MIAESMYNSCDASGNEYLMMDSIVDYHKSDEAISVSNQKLVHKCWSFMQRSTVIWHICVEWRDGSTTWKSLKNFKESHTLKTAEYAVSQKIYHEPEFNWLVKVVFKERLRIIYLFKNRNNCYLKKIHKFGI